MFLHLRFKSGLPNNVPISRGTSDQTPTLMSLLSTQRDGSSENNPDRVRGELQPGLNVSQQDSLPKATSIPQETEETSTAVTNGIQNLIPNRQVL